jgi:hypothetical protein
MDDVIQYGASKNVTVLPGIELSTLEQNKSVHLLGYFTDESYQSAELLAYFKDIKERRERRARTIIENLKHFNDIHISYDRVLHYARGIIARPHIAKAIVEAYPKYDHDDVFEQFIGDHCDAYVPSVEMPVQDGIDLLRKHNCLIVLAHPTLLKDQIKDTVLAYQFDGLEAKYIRNKPQEEELFTALAKERHMFTTAGSDFHGIPGDTKHGMIGDLTLQGEALQLFLQELKKNQQEEDQQPKI